MGRVQRAPVGQPVVGGHAAARHNEQAKQAKPEYKVQLEQITQKKKKLLAMTTYKIQAPPGYTFIPLTAPELTDKCKDLARIDGVQVHVVSTSKGGKNSTELSKQVGRVGHHFPSSIVSRALTSLGYDIDRSGLILSDLQRFARNVGHEASRKDQKGLRVGDGVTDPTELKKAQEKLNTEARQSLTTLFPNMPEKDKKAVVKHAFMIGKERIGSSAELSMDRRVHLAVLAHIRHGYTDYDKLLKQVPYQTARSIVEEKTLHKILQWRGEGENDDGMEEILREVIVIDDDEDEPNAGHVSLVDDGQEIQFRTSPIAAELIDSRPQAAASGYMYEDHRDLRSNAGHYAMSVDGQRFKIIDEERQRRYDDRVRNTWYQAKRAYREAIPLPVDAGSADLSRGPGGHVRYVEHPAAYEGRTLPHEQMHFDRRAPIAQAQPEIILLSKPQVGVTYEAAHGYGSEHKQRTDPIYTRRTPEREIVHQSIESAQDVPQQSARNEVIVLDSPDGPASNGKTSYVALETRDRRPMVERPEVAYHEYTYAAVNDQTAGRKRTIDEVDARRPNLQVDDRYAGKIVQLSGAHDHYMRQNLHESPSKVRTVECPPQRRVVSPRDATFGDVQELPAQPLRRDLHFYQSSQAPAPRNAHYVPSPQSVVHQSYPQSQFSSDQPRLSQVGREMHQRKPSIVQLSGYRDHDYKTTNSSNLPTAQEPYRLQAVPDTVSAPSISRPLEYKRVANHSRYPSGNVYVAASPEVRYVERPQAEDGVHKHLENLHFYGAPRPRDPPPAMQRPNGNEYEVYVDRRPGY